MRVINLKIKGLKSFEEETFIDFEKLSSKGLFGVFGETGSGKTSVLDAIIIALYGKQNGEKTNFINVNSDSAIIVLNFEVRGKITKKYRVERSFKRSENDGVRLDVARLFEVVGTEKKLIESQRKVSSKCEELIGLSLREFTKTVILPQGQFSEFLKMSNADRNKMLETLFGLEKFGESLSKKVANETNSQKNKSSNLEREIEKYQGITDEKKKELERIIDNLSGDLKNYDLFIDALKTKLVEFKEIEDLQIELHRVEDEKQELIATNLDVDDKRRKIDLNEAALRVYPTIKEFEKVCADIEEYKLEIENRKKELVQIEGAKEVNEKELKEISLKNIFVDDFKTAKIDLENLMRLNKDIKGIDESIESNEQKCAGDRKEKIEKNIKLESFKKELDCVLKQKVEIENRIEGLTCSVARRGEIESGIEKLNQIKREEENLERISEDIIEKQRNISDKEHGKISKLKDIESNNNEIKEIEESLKNLICPCTEDGLESIRVRVNELKNLYDKKATLEKELKGYSLNIEGKDSEIKIWEKQYLEEENLFVVAEKELEESKKNSLVSELKKCLHEGDSCPVCGSKVEIDITESEVNENVELLAKKANDLREKKNGTKNNIENGKARISEWKETIGLKEKELENTNRLINNEVIDKLEARLEEVKIALTDYNKKKAEYENKLSNLRVKGGSLESNLVEINKELKEIKAVLERKETELESKKDIVKVLKAELDKLYESADIKDFIAEKNLITSNEKKKELEEKTLKMLKEEERVINEKIQAYEDRVSILENNIKNIEQDISKNKGIKEAKEKEVVEKKRFLTYLNSRQPYLKFKNVEEKNKFYIEEVESFINDTEREYKRINNEKEELRSSEKIAEYSKASLEDSLNKNNSKRNDLKKEIEGLLEKYNFTDMNSVKGSLLNEGIKSGYLTTIKSFEDELAGLNKLESEKREKLKGRSVTREDVEKLKTNFDVKIEEQEKVKSEREFKRNELMKIEGLLDNANQAREEFEKSEKRRGYLEELKKVLEANAFVKYISVERLKYISLEASKTLYKISKGQYSLNVDSEGEFFIVDYRNGGKTRAVKTLSGGEVFLVSLSLSLSLSSEIQLRGASQIELFFLDEGFGTLDKSTLDIVMSSLENIPTENFKIGLISHVESLKDRVPMKLLVEKTDDGSKVVIG